MSVAANGELDMEQNCFVTVRADDSNDITLKGKILANGNSEATDDTVFGELFVIPAGNTKTSSGPLPRMNLKVEGGSAYILLWR